MLGLAVGIGGSLGLLLVTEVANLGSQTARLWAWRVILSLLMSLAFLLIPWLQVRLLLGKQTHSIFHLIALTVYVAVVWRLGGLRSFSGSTSFFSQAFCRAGSIGVTLMAVMAGYGAVMAPRQHLTRYIRKVDWTEISAIQKEKSILAQVQTSSPGDLEALEEAKRELELECEELAWHSRRLAQSRLTRWFYNSLGIFLGLFCLYRIVAAIITLVWRKSAGIDPITRFIGIISVGSHHFDASFYSQIMALIFVTLTLFTSLRSLLLHLNRLTRLLFDYDQSQFTKLLMAQVLSVYAIGNCLMLRLALPPQSRECLSQLTASLPLGSYRQWFEMVFLSTALITILLVNIIEGA